MNKVISICNSDYFQYGELFIHTRKMVNADFTVFGPDLTPKQQSILKKHRIEYRQIDQDDFTNKMQFLKFKFIRDTLKETNPGDGVALIDFDTFFMRDISPIFESSFNLGITVRNKYIKRGGPLRALANGGVIFSKNIDKSIDICDFALRVMTKGKNKDLPAYNKAFKEFETKSDKHVHGKWNRSNLRWWVDQVFLSSLVAKHMKSVKNVEFFDFLDFKIGLFNCDRYNLLDPEPKKIESLKQKGVYVVHLKNKGRERLKVFRKIILEK